mmetsp:Transcript_99828/g.321873  ORF Transcript_99828/g.321873 Transcript_99828/m.321873 type:complete len:340 (-) Transcript_99828:2536-3555(-)
MVVHAVVDVRLQLLQQHGHRLVPQRKVAEHAQLCHGRRVGRVLAALQEELVAQQVPDPIDAVGLALHCVDKHFHFLAVHDNVEFLVLFKGPVVDVPEHGVYQAQCPGRMFCEHLVQDLPQAPSTHLHAPVRDGVLNCRDQDVACLGLPLGVRGGRWSRRLLDQAQVDAATPVPQQHATCPADPEAHSGRRQPGLPELSLARVLRQWRHTGAFAHKPIATVVHFDAVARRKDCNVSWAQVCRDEQEEINAFRITDDHTHPLGMQKVGERLALVITRLRRHGVLGGVRAGRGAERQYDKNSHWCTACGLLVQFPISELLCVVLCHLAHDLEGVLVPVAAQC